MVGCAPPELVPISNQRGQGSGYVSPLIWFDKTGNIVQTASLVKASGTVCTRL